ncbi:MAG TPA: arginase family protein [Candidatus Polarisedimenticolaceae bacterium]|nr:arginase family protein [Candidatus Polarisedimenticolaceae bacterium]
MDLDLIVVPYEAGRRGVGVGAGPEALIEGGLAARLDGAGHDVRLVPVLAPEPANGREIAATFALMVQVSRAVDAARESGRLPLLLSGNCSVAAVGAVAGLRGRPAVVWFDAHGDLNTPETTTSGFFDGMALSVALGRCWTEMAMRVPGFQPVPARDVVLLGARDMDPGERAFLVRDGLRAIPVEELRRGLPRFLETVLPQVSAAYVHLDLDVLDPAVGRANAYAAPDGLREDDVIWTVRQVVSSVPLGALAITAYDPSYDREGRVAAAALRIAEACLR